MAVTAKWYGKALMNAFGGTTSGESPQFDFLSDTVKIALLDSGYTPDQDAHDFFDDVEAEEISGTGYTAGGATLASKTLTYTGGTNVVKFDAADVTWTTSTLTARYAVIYVVKGGASSADPLLFYIDFGADVSTTAGTFQITFDAAGIATITAS